MEDKTENFNFFSIQNLLSEATKLIRKYFVESWNVNNNTEWTDDENAGEYFQTGSGLSIKRSVRPHQREILQSGNSSLWDLSLLGLIFSSEPFKNYGKSNLVRSIRDKRNQIFHNPNFSISNEEFEFLWTEISNAMIELGYSKESLDKNKLINTKSIMSNILTEEKVKQIKNEANEEVKKENFQKAIDLYSSALVLTGLSENDAGILYSNRSFGYLKLHESNSKNKIDQRNLMRALNDAQMAINSCPKWFKAYYRLGQVYKELGDLEDSQENFKIALLLQPDDQSIKNALAAVKFTYFEQFRHAEIDEMNAPGTAEEKNLNFFKKYIEKIGITQSEYEKNSDEVKKIAIKEDPTLSDVWLAHEYRDGSQNIIQNYELAAKYYGKAASAGNAEALYNLALLYKKGLGVLKDFKIAFSLLKQAASKDPTRKMFGLEIPTVGVAEAEHSIGINYQYGIFVEKDTSVAVSWYKRAVEHGNACAANNLGILYDNELKDLDQAERMYLLAHKRGENKAISNLVDLYLSKNQPDDALLWHERALNNNSLSDSCRDEEIREQIKLLKNISHAIPTQQTNQANKQAILMDPNRISLIKWHRQSIDERLKFYSPNPKIIKNTYKPPKQQHSSYSINNLKYIKFKEVDFTKDHVLDGYKLKITIFDIPFENSFSIFFLILDEDEYMERMAVYNLGNNFEKIKKTYPIGSRFLIMNPYIRMAVDGKPMIRIDDPKSIISLESIIPKMCRYCGNQDSKFNCSRCLNSFYCSKDCQTNDWKLLDHKLICFPKK